MVESHVSSLIILQLAYISKILHLVLLPSFGLRLGLLPLRPQWTLLDGFAQAAFLAVNGNLHSNILVHSNFHFLYMLLQRPSQYYEHGNKQYMIAGSYLLSRA